MKITVKVKPNARKNEVLKQEDGTFLVSVSVPATEGKANEKLIEVLAGYFGKPKRTITIISGRGSRTKIIGVA